MPGFGIAHAHLFAELITDDLVWLSLFIAE